MGADIPSMAETLQNAGADSIGINCSVGPEAMLKMAGISFEYVLDEVQKYDNQ